MKQLTAKDHASVAAYVSEAFNRTITADRVRDVDVNNDWQASHPVDALILARLDKAREKRK